MYLRSQHDHRRRYGPNQDRYATVRGCDCRHFLEGGDGGHWWHAGVRHRYHRGHGGHRRHDVTAMAEAVGSEWLLPLSTVVMPLAANTDVYIGALTGGGTAGDVIITVFFISQVA